MSRPIQIGDMVQVVRPYLCCGSTRRIGTTFIVHGFGSRPETNGQFLCGVCGHEEPMPVDAVQAPPGTWGIKFPASWRCRLIVIAPKDKVADTETAKELQL